MNNNHLPLVTFEQAKKLKEAGFDWPTRCHFTPHSRSAVVDDIESTSKNAGIYPAPTVALALKWIRDVKHYPCGVYPRAFWNNILCCTDLDYAEYHGCGKVLGKIIDAVEDTYDSAESALLDELLNLIENENRQVHNNH